jgi:tetratricopeptide (TPR) repeat protein
MVQALKALFARWEAMFQLRLIDNQNSNDYNKMFQERMWEAFEDANCGNTDRALKTWREMRAAFPTKVTTSEPALRLLLKLEAFDEADAMIKEARKRYPGLQFLGKAYVQVARERGDSDETLRRCAVVQREFPRLADGYLIAAECLVNMGQSDEAEAVIERAVRKVPAELDLLVGYARHAEQRQKWPEALRRWELVRDRFDHIYSHNGIANCLRKMGRLDEAEKAAADTCERFPDQPWAFATLAVIAQDRGDLAEASRRWAFARRRVPYFAYAYKAGAEIARRAGHHQEADGILASGVTMIRGDLELHLEYARSARGQADQGTAAERWALVQERFPANAEAREQVAVARAALERQDRS